jgi:hypothetical protein
MRRFSKRLKTVWERGGVKKRTVESKRNVLDTQGDVVAALNCKGIRLHHSLLGSQEILELKNAGIVQWQVLLRVPRRRSKTPQPSISFENFHQQTRKKEKNRKGFTFGNELWPADLEESLLRRGSSYLLVPLP